MAKTLTQTAQNYMDEYQKRLRGLGQKKYGMNYNPSLDWYRQSAEILPAWSQTDEEKARLELQALQNYQFNAQTLQNQSRQLQQGAVREKAQLGLDNQLVQKYLGTNLRALGQNTSGVAESTMAQQGNTYLSNLANINRDTSQSAQNLYSAYSNQMKADESALGQRLYETQETYDYMLGSQLEEELGNLGTNNLLTSRAYEELRDKYAQQGLSQNVIKQLDTTYLPHLQERQELTSVDIDPNAESYDLDTITPLSFGNYSGSGKVGSLQTKYLEKAFKSIKDEPTKYKGKIINLNFGAGKADNYYIHIKNGRIILIKTKKKENLNHLTFEHEEKMKNEQ